MPVIRAIEAERNLPQAEVLRFQDLEAEAAQIVAAARQKAEAILAQARIEAERVKAEARRAGHEEGRAAGLKAGMEAGRKEAFEQAAADFTRKQATLVEALRSALEQLEARRRAMLAEFERDVVALAGAIARRVTKMAAQVEPGCLAENLREALQLVADKTRLEVRVNPDDLARAEQLALEFLSGQDGGAVRFVPDPAVARGGATLRTRGGQIDATFERQWARIMDEILAGWREHWLIGLAAGPTPGGAGAPANGRAAGSDGSRHDRKEPA